MSKPIQKLFSNKDELKTYLQTIMKSMKLKIGTYDKKIRTQMKVKFK